MDREIDLGLGLGQRVESGASAGSGTCAGTGAGAGANANSRSMRIDRTFVGARPLTELVWSRQKGLSVKCAGCSTCFAEAHSPPICHVRPHLDEVKRVLEKGKSIPVGEGLETAHLLPRLATEAETNSDEKKEETAENDIVEKESDQSMESGNLVSSNKRWRGFEEQLIIGSKRVKNQSQECLVKQDTNSSSFMNWISNIVKGTVKPPFDHHHDKSFTKTLEFQTVFQSLYSSQDANSHMECSKSKQIMLFDKQTASNQKALSAAACFICGKSGHELHSCLHENANVCLNKTKKNKVSNEENMPKDMFDKIRRLRLSRTDILKWMKSRSPIAKLDGYFVRLRLAKWEEGVEGAGYYVACITDGNPSKGSNNPIRVNIGGVECLVESRYISNCDFLEDELISWWRTTLKSEGAPKEEDLTSKLEGREKLVF